MNNSSNSFLRAKASDNRQSITKKNKPIVIEGSNSGSLTNSNNTITVKGDNYGKIINKNDSISIEGDNRGSVKNKNDSITIEGDNHGDIKNHHDTITIAKNNTNTVTNKNGDIQIGGINHSTLYNKNGDIKVHLNEGSMQNVNGDLVVTSLDLEIWSEGTSSSKTVIKATARSLFGTMSYESMSSGSGKIIIIKSPDLNVTINPALGLVKQRDHEIVGERIGDSDVIVYELYGGYEIVNIKNVRKLLYESQLLVIEDDELLLTYTPTSLPPVSPRMPTPLPSGDDLYDPDDLVESP